MHKASHHFDLLNWWLDSEPTEVYAMGGLEVFGRANDFRGDKCRTCQHTAYRRDEGHRRLAARQGLF